jgi:probable F420-dependent oxidoreductase
MRLHAYVPSETPNQPADEVVRLGELAEELGYHQLWAPDHPLPPFEYRDFYAGVWEPLVLLSHIAARTSRIRLATGALIPALRNPFITAKQIATLDTLSGGRLDIGVGIGFVAKEYENVGADFATRGARTDEIIALWKHLFATGRGSFAGKFYEVGEPAVFAPAPVQGDRIPVWIGGRSDFAWRRAARLGDGWLCAMTEADVFATNVKKMRELAGRPVRAGARILFTDLGATVEQALDEIETWEAAGTDDLVVWFGGPEGYADRMQVFAEAWQASGRADQATATAGAPAPT